MNKTLEQSSKKNILIVHRHEAFGGAEVHILKLYKSLLALGHNIQILVPKNSPLEPFLKKENLGYLTTNAFSFFRSFNFLYKFLLARDIYKICKKNKIEIINCNSDCELKPAKLVTKLLPIKVVLTRHATLRGGPFSPARIKNIDGIVAVSAVTQKDLMGLNQKHNLNIKNIEWITPFFDDDKFINFKTNSTRENFFKTNFGITISSCPILCMIAMMYNDGHKNHALLIKAIHELVYKKHKPVQLMLPSGGDLLDECKTLVKNLKLENYVFFLGFTKKLPELIYHCDINVLPSTEEGLGIVLLEAALLKKPSIGTAGTGMEAVIKHNQTGLLFENNNLNDLVTKIEMLVDSNELQQTLGKNAFEFVNDNCLIKTSTQKFDTFLSKVLNA